MARLAIKDGDYKGISVAEAINLAKLEIDNLFRNELLEWEVRIITDHFYAVPYIHPVIIALISSQLFITLTLQVLWTVIQARITSWTYQSPTFAPLMLADYKVWITTLGLRICLTTAISYQSYPLSLCI